MLMFIINWLIIQQNGKIKINGTHLTTPEPLFNFKTRKATATIISPSKPPRTPPRIFSESWESENIIKNYRKRQ